MYVYCRLGQMQNHVEHLLVAYSEHVPSSSSSADDPATVTFANTCAEIVQSLCREVWPCLALVGGVNTGYVRGGWFDHCLSSTQYTNHCTLHRNACIQYISLHAHVHVYTCMCKLQGGCCGGVATKTSFVGVVIPNCSKVSNIICFLNTIRKHV